MTRTLLLDFPPVEPVEELNFDTHASLEPYWDGFEE